MFGDEQASAKEISLFFLCVTSMSGLTGFRDNETGDARANVHCAVTPPPTFYIS